MSKIIGVYPVNDDRVVCVGCASNHSLKGEWATADGLPDGFSCEECGAVVNAWGLDNCLICGDEYSENGFTICDNCNEEASK